MPFHNTYLCIVSRLIEMCLNNIYSTWRWNAIRDVQSVKTGFTSQANNIHNLELAWMNQYTQFNVGMD